MLEIGCMVCVTPCQLWVLICTLILQPCTALTLVNCAPVFRRTWRVLGTIWHLIRVRAQQLVRVCALTCGGLLDRQTARQICCGCHSFVRLWWAFCGLGRAVMLCPMSLVLGPGCLALSGCVLYVNHHTQMNGIHC